MFKEIKNFLSANKQYRGWRLVLDSSSNSYFLSKFDDTYNEDEYRFFVKDEDGLIKITRCLKIKNYKEPKDLKSKNKNLNYIKAEEIVNILNQNRLVITN